MGLQSFPVFAPKSGLKTDVIPAFLPNDAWSQLNNAYCWRERVVKREGLKFMGRLARNLTGSSIGTTSASSPTTISTLFSVLSIPETTAELDPGTLVITVAAPDTATFTDNGNGTFTVTGKGLAAGSYVNYDTGLIVLAFTAPTGGAAITATFSYFPSLPVMGIVTQYLSQLPQQQTIWFDTTYAYIWNQTDFMFQEFIPGTTWASSNSDFFWGYNYTSTDNTRILFVTNFVNSAANPMRYTNGISWTTFQPIILDNPPSAAQSLLYSAKILIAYYGRLLALNTWEGTTAGGNAGAANFFNRCRFSQLGDPTAANAWRSDQFGKGGFLDAPTAEAIVGVRFIRNTLVVTFENSTWQLRYVGEYGLPFVWERISSDFGSDSTFSSVLFDNFMLLVGNRAITSANANAVTRIDLDIPDQVFNIENANNGNFRVFGIRNYQKEIVYWNYPDARDQSVPGTALTFPNKVLIYNYRNNTWAIFRDSITAFGNFQNSNNINWNSNSVSWDSYDVKWDDEQLQTLFPSVVAGNQQGFIHLYQEDAGYQVTFSIQEEPSLSITGINLSSVPIQLTVNNHNLITGEIIYIDNLNFLDPSNGYIVLATNLNNNFYQVARVIDANTITITKWNGVYYSSVFPFTPSPSNYYYAGGGRITLMPKLDVISKDINIYQAQSLQTKLSRLDFLMAASTQASMTVNIYLNSSFAVSGNLLIGNQNVSTALSQGFYPQGSDYAWFRFYTTLAGQYFKVEMTYNDALMNTVSTHSNPWTLYAMNAWCRPGGKNVF